MTPEIKRIVAGLRDDSVCAFEVHDTLKALEPTERAEVTTALADIWDTNRLWDCIDNYDPLEIYALTMGEVDRLTERETEEFLNMVALELLRAMAPTSF